MISDEDIQKVSAATDFVALVQETVPVVRKGHDYWCCCPFHHEKTASCKIDAAENLFHCFGCGEGGTVFSYVMKLYDMGFREAVHFLADRAHIEIEDTAAEGASTSEKRRIVECCEEACNFFSMQLLRGKSDGCKNARAYLAKRKFNIDIAKKWKLGYAPGHGSLIAHLQSKGFTPEEAEKANLAFVRNGRMQDRFFNRVMFPIFDSKGDCIAFGGRVIGDGEPKYLNSSDTLIFHKSNVLFGLDKAKSAMTATGCAAVVEGYTDVIACHEAGIENVVATLGTALTMQHIKLLSRYATRKIVYLFDGDEAGQRAAERALQFIDYKMTPEAGQSRCDLHAATIPGSMDPAEYIEAKGPDAMRQVLDNSGSLIDFGINRKISKHDLSTPEGRSRALVDAISILAPIKDSILAKDYASKIAFLTRVNEADALEQLKNLKPPRRDSGDEIQDFVPNVRVHEAPGTKAASPANREPVELSAAEIDRRKNERELVSLGVNYPALALSRGDDLLGIQWHVPLHKVIIEKITDMLMDDLNLSSTVALNRISQEIPGSDSIITSALADSDEDAKANFNILITNVIVDDLDAVQETLTYDMAVETDNKKRAEILNKISEIAQKKIKITSQNEQ